MTTRKSLSADAYSEGVLELAFSALTGCIPILPETRRKGFVLSCFSRSGLLYLPFVSTFLNEVSKLQRPDFAWTDVVETSIYINLIKTSGDDKLSDGTLSQSLDWIRSEATSWGSWGMSKRDIPRIPITSSVISLCPELATNDNLSWLEQEWQRDLRSEVSLSYKGSFFLIAFAAAGKTPKDTNIIQRTVEFVAESANPDGGFAPWKGHPIGSEPWSTGIALIGLTAWPELTKPETLEKALLWLAGKQLPNGLWPCHYIEEGSAYCYWGVVEALKYLKRIGRSCAV